LLHNFAKTIQKNREHIVNEEFISNRFHLERVTPFLKVSVSVCTNKMRAASDTKMRGSVLDSESKRCRGGLEPWRVLRSKIGNERSQLRNGTAPLRECMAIHLDHGLQQNGPTGAGMYSSRAGIHS